MLQRGGKAVPSGGQTSSDGAGPVASLSRQLPNDQLQTESPGFPEWIDASLEVTDTEVSHLVAASAGPSAAVRSHHQKRCCRTSTSSGYSSHSPPLSGGSYSSASCPPTGTRLQPQRNPSGGIAPVHRHHHHHQQQQQQQQQIVGIPGLAVIHEAETIPRPIWPCMSEDIREIHPSALSAARCEMIDCEVAAAHAIASVGEVGCRKDSYASCGYCCVCSAYGYRNSSGAPSASSSSAREVLLELSRTLNSVIDAESDLSAEEILRDISITVARGIRSKELPPPSSGICEDYTYRLSSTSSSAGGKESSVGVNPVNLRVYGKPKWLHVPASSRSSSHCPYEGKTLLNAAQHASRTQPATFGANNRQDTLEKTNDVAPAVFLLPQGNNCAFPPGLNAYPGKSFKTNDCKNPRKLDAGSGKFDPANRKHPMGRLNPGNGDNCGEKCTAGEPVYSTQLDGSDESSSYGAIDEAPSKKVWNESKKVFDRHLDFTLDGNRAERLGRAIAKAKRKRQWCRGLTAVFGLVFFVLSVVVVSLSVTRGRKVFGSM